MFRKSYEKLRGTENCLWKLGIAFLEFIKGIVELILAYKDPLDITEKFGYMWETKASKEGRLDVRFFFNFPEIYLQLIKQLC